MSCSLETLTNVGCLCCGKRAATIVYEDIYGSEDWFFNCAYCGYQVFEDWGCGNGDERNIWYSRKDGMFVIGTEHNGAVEFDYRHGTMRGAKIIKRVKNVSNLTYVTATSVHVIYEKIATSDDLKAECIKVARSRLEALVLRSSGERSAA